MAYPDVVLADTPLAYWRFEETSGTTATDSSGNGRSLTWTGTPGLGVAGLVVDGTAVSLSGDDGASRALQTFTSRTVYTVECWFRTTSTASQFLVLHFGSSGNGSWGLQMSRSGTGVGTITFRNYSGTAAQITTPAAYNDGLVHHVVAVQESSTGRIYIDGVQVVSGAMSNIADFWDLYVGRDNSTGGRFTGTLDEIAYYGTALSAARIQAHHQAGTGVGSISAALSASATLTARATSPARLALTLTATSDLSFRFKDQAYPLAAQLSATSGLTAIVNTRSQLRATLGAVAGTQARLVVRSWIAATLAADSGLTARVAVHIRMDIPVIDLDLAIGVDDGSLHVHQLDIPAVELHLDVTTGVRPGYRTYLRRGVERWHFQNPVTGEDWELPLNPNTMTSPHRSREIVTTAGAGPHGSFEGGLLTVSRPPRPKQWEFGGVINTESHYQELNRWALMESPIFITDHLDRTWEVVVETFAPEDRRTGAGHLTSWRYMYTMRVLVMRRMR